jgi:hypothetical protein
MSRPWERRWVQALFAALLLLSVVLGRVVVESRRELAVAEALHRQGRVDEAVEHWRRAARWYAPGNPAVTASLHALAAVGTTAEATGKVSRALAAWRAVRSAILATRSLYVPHPQELAEANEHIARLMAQEQQKEPLADGGAKAAGAGGPRPFEELRAWHLALLQRSDAPEALCAVFALLGCATWVGGALLFIFRGVGPDDALQRRPAVMSLVLVVLGFTAFLVGLRLA